jgi:hypothetical protein
MSDNNFKLTIFPNLNNTSLNVFNNTLNISFTTDINNNINTWYINGIDYTQQINFNFGNGKYIPGSNQILKQQFEILSTTDENLPLGVVIYGLINEITGTSANSTTFFLCGGDDNGSTSIIFVQGGSSEKEYSVNYFFERQTNIVCFSEGTKILCLTEYLMEEYRLVQDLIVGDLVKAYMNDYKPIKNIMRGSFTNNPKNRSNCMYIMNKTEDNGLIEDLIVTGNHGILLDEKDVNEEEQKKNPKWANFKVDDKVNCIAGVSSKFEPITDNELYKYYHFSLDNGDGKKRRFGVWANGVLMETMP